MSSSAEQALTLPPTVQPRTLLDLPPEVMRMVADHLKDSELNSLARTCNANYTKCNWELYRRDSKSLNPQALLWGFRRERSPWTALHFAAVFNQVEATKFLLQHGADVKAVCPRDGYFVLADVNDPLPRPPLFTALKTKSEDVAEVLLSHGASPLWAPPGTGRHAKETALYLAAHLGMWKLLELIVRAGVDVNAGCHVDDVPRWSTDPAGKSILRKLCYNPRKPTEKVITELVRLGAKATVREIPGRTNMVHLLLQLITGTGQGRATEPDWPLASILLRTGACDGTLEEIEVLAAIQLTLFPRNCPYTPNLTRHTLSMSNLTYLNKNPRAYSIKACLVGTRCKCKELKDRYPENEPINGRKWQTELLQELVNFQVRFYGRERLDAALPFLTETVLTLLARHRHRNTVALDIWLELMPDDHKTKVVNVRRQTALHIALNIDSFDEKLWYVEGKPTKDIDRAFDQQHDVLFYLLERCTSEELLAQDVKKCTPLQLLLGALYWGQDEEYYSDYGADLAGPGNKPLEPFSEDVWARKCLAFVERMLTEIPEMSDSVYWRVVGELHWRRWELSCESGLIYLGRTGGRGRVPHYFPSFKPRDGEVKRPIPQNSPLLPTPAKTTTAAESAPPAESTQAEEPMPPAEATQPVELPTRPDKHALPDEPVAPEKRQRTTESQATAENTTTDHSVAEQPHASPSTPVSWDDLDFETLMENVQEEYHNAWSN
ncbi:ankyrin repeat-containing domain protein [Neurospora tetraspora]|uniref:Ankyrin repeat-containing domain protein n=1 Tax=Neurospora tetraspora TaxID=94610 RepID=A0AAE0JK53_9PEZI|nr:ankyrin repeat-containing domain protein [Neurospora tetraspora]